MKNTINHQSVWVPIAGALSILAFLTFLFTNYRVSEGIPAEEIGPILTNALTIVPALLGFWKFANRPVSSLTRWGFLIYALLIVGGYANVLLADDPLAAGLPMVVFVLPYVLVFTGYLVYRLGKSSVKAT